MDFMRRAILGTAFLVGFFGFGSASDVATAASVRISHSIPKAAHGPNALLLKTAAVADASPAGPTYGPPYYSGEWQSYAPCENQHSIYFSDGPPEGDSVDAEDDYESQVNGCFGPYCTFTMEPDDPKNPDAPYIVAYVELGGGCEGGVDIYQTAHSANVGSGAVNDGGEGDHSSDAVPYVGDPINAASGNKYLRTDDFDGAHWLTFRRLYNSDPTSVSTEIGAHWRHSFDRSLQVLGTPASTVIMTRPDGSQEIFQKASGQWTTTASVDQLTETDNAQGVATLYTVFIGAKRDTETYSATGLLLSVTDEAGQGITLTYSTASTPAAVAPTAGLLLTVTDPKGSQLNFVYGSNGLISQLTLPDQGTIAYAYDGAGELTSVTYPDKSKVQYFYNESGLVTGDTYYGTLTGIVDESGNRYSTTAYDASGRAIATNLGGYNYTATSGGAYITQVAYNNDGSSTTTYPLGHSATMTFAQTSSGLSQIASVDQSCAPDCHQRWKTRSYDANGYPASSTDFNGNTTTTQYDAYGELNVEVDGSGTASQRTINTTWDTTMRVPLTRTVLDENNNPVTKTAWVYNPQGQPLAKCQIDPAKAGSYVCAATGTPPAGVRRWTYTYCTAVGTNCPLVGLLLTSAGPRTDLTQTTTYTYYTTSSATGCGIPGSACYQAGDLHTIKDALGHVTTIASYDADGRVTRITDANGVNTDSTYTPRGWLATRIVGGATTIFTYWPYGAVETIKDPDGVTMTFSYDHAHRLIEIQDDLGDFVQYTLDGSGNKLDEQTYSANPQVLVRSLTRTFNTLGQLTTIVDGLNQTVFSAGMANSYDANGNLVLSADALGIQRQQGFDPLNRLISTVDNYNGTDVATQNTSKTMAYDSMDRLNGVMDPDGLDTIYTYDGLGNRTGLQSPDTGSSSDTYDAAGNRLTHTDAEGIVSTFTYDALNRLTSTTYPDATQNVSYTYDEANTVTGCSSSEPEGRLTRIVEYGVTTIYCYDARGNVLQKSQVMGAQTDITVYTYTSANRLKTEKTPDGTLVSYTYDGNGRISGMQLTPAGSSTAITVVSAVTWLPFGPVKSYELGNGQTITRAYDANYRLTDLTSPALTLHFARDVMGDISAMGNAAGASPATETYSYDPLYRLTGISDAGTPLETYTYDKTGDRLNKTAPGLAAGAYSYAPNTHQLVATGNAERANDANGNLTGSMVASSAYGFGYNDRNRLVSVVLNGTTVGTYSYNALGQRIEKVTTATERYGYDENNHLVGEYGNTDRDYLWMGDIPVAVVDVTVTGGMASSVVNYIYADHLNTPRAVANSSGTVIWTWAFQGNPFGEKQPTSSTGYTLNLRFAGQYYDIESGLVDNINRTYDPTVGRYVQSDPIGLNGGIDTYAYAYGDPLDYSDSSGQCPWCVGAIIGAVAGGIAGYETGGWEGAVIGGVVGGVVGAAAPWAAATVGGAAEAAVAYVASDSVAAVVGQGAAVATFTGVNAGGSAVGAVATNAAEGQPLMNNVGTAAAIGAAASVPEGFAVATGAAEADVALAAGASAFTGLNVVFGTALTIPYQPIPRQLPAVPTITPEANACY